MRMRTHIVICVVLFPAYAYFFSRIHPMNAILMMYGFFGVALGSVFPDFVEPATTSRHRGLFHSRRALSVTGVLFILSVIIGIFPSGYSDPFPAYPASCFLLGYVSHLLADSLTRAGLPD